MLAMHAVSVKKDSGTVVGRRSDAYHGKCLQFRFRVGTGCWLVILEEIETYNHTPNYNVLSKVQVHMRLTRLPRGGGGAVNQMPYHSLA